MKAHSQNEQETAGRGWKLSDLGPVLEALQGLRFGSVEIFVQDGKLVQIDRREKISGPSAAEVFVGRRPEPPEAVTYKIPETDRKSEGRRIQE